MPVTQGKQVCLTAAYKSPDNKDFNISKPINTPPSTSSQDKSTYLENLRRAASEIQEQINKELTARMEEDMARGSATGQAKPGTDEDQEEQNYGEELQEED